MQSMLVRDVMTDAVVVARGDTSYKQLVDVLADCEVSAVPVVDADDRVLGVVSEADLLHKVEFDGAEPHSRLLDRLLRRSAREKATGDTAAELMTSPAVTVRPETPLAQAARLMEQRRVKRLPVVDESGRLVGLVSRRDLLRPFSRGDAEIRRDVVEEVLGRTLAADPRDVRVEVVDGVVTVTGQVGRRSTVDIIIRLVRGVPGVVDVVSHLECEYDDTDEVRRRYVFGFPPDQGMSQARH
ncbi:MAG TPA: CBS domain-containing protein [Pilimelia sp.]|nr:CBS domain-containing protein [Pilimelia sp.]